MGWLNDIAAPVVRRAGQLVAQRKTLNLGAGLLATDNAALDRVDITLDPALIAAPVTNVWRTVAGTAVPVVGASWQRRIDHWLALTATQEELLWYFTPPSGCTLSGMRVNYFPATGHSALPEYMPSIALYRQTQGSNYGLTVVSSLVDSSATVAAYEGNKELLDTSFTHVVTNTDVASYAIRFRGERGTNAVAGLKVHPIVSIRATVQVGSIW